MKSNPTARSASNIVRVDFRRPRFAPVKALPSTAVKAPKSKRTRELLAVSLARDTLRNYFSA